MALIRCPNCEAEHDIDSALLAQGLKKMRCARCRTVFEPPANLANQAEPVTAPVDEALPADQSAIDDIFGTPEPQAKEPEEIATTTPAPSEASMAREPRTDEPEPSPRELRRRSAGSRSTQRAKPAKPKSSAGAAIATMFFSAGFGTLIALGIFRHEAVRLVPETATLYTALGFDVNTRGLEIGAVHSKLVVEEARETLEVAGKIANLTRHPVKVPVLRLSIADKGGREIYVWTATADQTELGAYEKIEFRRRLASPPLESHAVMVRFIAKDDIVASIR